MSGTKHAPASSPWWIALVLVLLAAPALGMLMPLHDDPHFAAKELRSPAPAPGWPSSVRGWSRWSRRVDAYLRDHFAFRRLLVTAYSLARYKLGSGNSRVLIGREGHLFYLGDEALAQSAGRIARPDWLGTTVTVIAELKAALAARHAKLLVAFPPNAATIEVQDLPAWARSNGRLTEYDEVLARLAANGIKALDLRPALLAAGHDHNAYLRQDTHWSWLGAIAGFNAIVAADGHPDWQISPNSPQSEGRVSGDLARLLGLGGLLWEPVRGPLLAHHFEHRVLAQNLCTTYLDAESRPGPTIMVFGDSFTSEPFEALIMQHAARLIWAPHEDCEFDWSLIDRFHPDEVWYVPTERLMPCKPGHQSRGMPRSDRLASTVNGVVVEAPIPARPE